MMKTRRSLLIFGALLAAFALGNAGPTWAQVTSGDPPTDVDANASDHATIVVTWSEPGTAVLASITSYQVGWAESSATDLVGVALKTATATGGNRARQHIITGLDAGTDYVVAVRVRGKVEADGTGANATSGWAINADTVTTEDAPMPSVVNHRRITVTPGDMTLQLDWDDPDPGGDDLMIDDYDIQYADNEDMDNAETWPHRGSDTMATITGLDNGVMYYVQIKAKNDAGGESDWSRAVMGTPMAPAEPELTAPMNVMATPGDGMLMVSWDAVMGADSYNVTWMAGGVTANATAMGTSHTIENLMNGTAYTVTVSAMKDDMEGPASEAVSGTPMPADPVPALPLFGMLALGAGLVAAGRRRLRTQRLLRN